jgi:hypothetical protein
MRFLPFLLLLAAGFCAVPKNQTQPRDQPAATVQPAPFTGDYAEAWRVIDSLENEGLYKSALEQVEALQVRAKKDKNSPQVIKALIFRGKYTTWLEEDGFVKAVQQFEAEVALAPALEKAVLESMLGELYSAYLETEGWKIGDRTPIPDGEGGDILTWSAAQLERRALQLYQSSLKPEALLRQTQVEYLRDITTPGENDTVTAPLRPTLFDFLAFRALRHFSNERSYLTEPAYKFYVDQAEAFAPAAEFARTSFSTQDSNSGKWLALRLFQTMTAAHLGDQDPSALLDIERQRLEFVFNNSVHADKDTLYEQALIREIEQYNHPSAAEFMHLLAAQYFAQGDIKPTQRIRAASWCEQAIRQYAGSFGARQCAILLAEIQTRSLQLTTEEAYLPARPMLALIEYKNLKNVWLRAVPAPQNIYSWQDLPQAQQTEYLRNQPAAWQERLSVPDPGDYAAHTMEFKIPALPTGRWIIQAAETPEFDPKTGYVTTCILTVSKLAAMLYVEDGQTNIYTVDRAEGAPRAGVRADLFYQEWNRKEGRSEWLFQSTQQSSPEGKIQLDAIGNNRNVFIRLNQDGDTLWIGRGFVNYDRPERSSQRIARFFTDRSIYRPGQTVYFKTVLLNVNPQGIPEVVPNTKVSLAFYDANGQVQSKLDLRSNAFGTVQGAFQAPVGGLTGGMHIQAEGWNDAAYFNVEEYKRPRFEVTFQPVEGAFRLGETITARGVAKNYAGNPVDGAELRYRVVRTARFPFWNSWFQRFPWNSSEMEITSGVATTDAAGNFSIPFPALPDRAIPEKEQPIFNYTVYADVTDISGETRSSQQSVSVGYAALEVELPESNTIHLDSLAKFEVKTRNLAGQFQAASGNITLQRLVKPAQWYNKRYWQAPDQWIMSEGDYKRDFPDYAWKEADLPINWDRADFISVAAFNTEQNSRVNLQTGPIRPGYYLLTLEATDPYGVPVKIEKIIAVWNEKEPIWRFDNPGIQLDKNSYAPGETARVWLGSPAAGMQFLVGTERKGRFETLRWQKTEGVVPYEIRIQESDRGGCTVHAQTVWNNRLYDIKPQYLAVPWTNKALNVQFESFRDKLAPGQEETWRIKISGPDKDKVAAEMVAAMYDASLDQFLPHSWRGIAFPQYGNRIDWGNVGVFGAEIGRVDYEKRMPGVEYFNRTYQNLNWFNFPMYPTRAVYSAAYVQDTGMKLLSAPAPSARANGTDRMEAFAAPASLALDAPAEDEAAAPAPLPLRANLNETVFFFPTLQTDTEGNILLKFTMNEALTRWKLLLFAHTPSLQTALETREVVTQKDLMLIANPPRFLRAGDAFEFTAKVSNLTNSPLNGTATLTLLDAATRQPLDAAFGLTAQNRQLPFSTAAEQSAPLKWNLQVPTDFSGAVVWQAFAETATVRDGEENILPVVTNRMLVTETLPITVRGNQTKTFDFEEAGIKESATRKNHRYTLEFSSNPAWYAVQSLPYLMEFPNECNEQIFNRLYANSLAWHVTQKQPAIRRVYERWKADGALKSNLQKNQELKSALLEETPWVLDAQSEAQQQQNIALLFDLNRMTDERDRALSTLANRQYESGGWPWFPGGRESWYVTQYILSGFGHLNQLGAMSRENDPRTSDMINRALQFCQEEAQKYFLEIEEAVQAGRTKWEDDHLNGLMIHYLYTRSFFTVERTDQVTDYFLAQAEKYWLGKGLYQEGMLALALHRHGRPEAATRIVNSLRERALVKEELGMYWAQSWGYYWYQLPVETQALMVEVFDEVAQDRTAVENLRIWLLKNKQTNRWETTKATAEAVYALLLRGDDWLSNTKPVQVSVGATPIRPQEAESGTGYFKQSWNGGEVKRDWHKITVENPNNHIVWGAAYWQYFEDLDKISTFKKTPLTVVKTLYREENSPTGPVLVALQAGDGLKVGDKVKVRIELRVDREMEFVHLKDMRAAGLEPINVLSAYRWQGGLGYYESTKDLATHFFFDYLPRGTFVLEYPVVVSHKGDMSNGITTLQCMYAPEFSSHSEGIRLQIR